MLTFGVNLMHWTAKEFHPLNTDPFNLPLTVLPPMCGYSVQLRGTLCILVQLNMCIVFIGKEEILVVFSQSSISL